MRLGRQGCHKGLFLHAFAMHGWLRITLEKPSPVVHAFNPNIWEV